MGSANPLPPDSSGYRVPGTSLYLPIRPPLPAVPVGEDHPVVDEFAELMRLLREVHDVSLMELSRRTKPVGWTGQPGISDEGLRLVEGRVHRPKLDCAARHAGAYGLVLEDALRLARQLRQCRRRR